MSEFADLDYEEIDEIKPSDDRPDDFLSMMVNKVYNFDWYFLLAVAISFIIIVSDMYNEKVIHKIPGAQRGGELTTRGYLMQLVSLLFGSVLFKVLFSVL